MGMEFLRHLHLIAGNLGGNTAVSGNFQRHFRKRHADIAAHADLIVMAFEQQAQERNGSRLAVGTRYRTDGRLFEPIGQFHFAGHPDFPLVSGLNQGDTGRHRRRNDDEAHPVQEFFRLRAEHAAHAHVPQFFKIIVQIRFVLGITQCNLCA